MLAELVRRNQSMLLKGPQATSTATGFKEKADDKATQDAAKAAAIKPKTEAVEPRMAELMRESGIDRSKVKALLRRATGKPATGPK